MMLQSQETKEEKTGDWLPQEEGSLSTVTEGTKEMRADVVDHAG